MNNLQVTRKSYVSKKDGKTYFNYVVIGNIRRTVGGKVMEKSVQVDFQPKDFGGYEVLDLIFFNTETANLVVEPKTMVNDATGEVLHYTDYIVQSTDDDGNVFSYKMKLSRESDKSLLEAIMHSQQA